MCKCDCGNEKIILGKLLKNGKTKSCGCLQKEMIGKTNKKYNIYDLSGEYGIGYTSNTNNPFYFDLEDYNLIKDYCWYEDNVGYITTKENNKIIFQHRLIMGVTDKKDVIDHVYHEINDNRKYKLRICKQNQNAKNNLKPKNNTSGYKGVTWDKENGKWRSQITVDGKNISLGRYDKIEDAVEVRKKAEIKYFGEYRYKKEGEI